MYLFLIIYYLIDISTNLFLKENVKMLMTDGNDNLVEIKNMNGTFVVEQKYVAFINEHMAIIEKMLSDSLKRIMFYFEDSNIAMLRSVFIKNTKKTEEIGVLNLLSFDHLNISLDSDDYQYLLNFCYVDTSKHLGKKIGDVCLNSVTQTMSKYEMNKFIYDYVHVILHSVTKLQDLGSYPKFECLSTSVDSISFLERVAALNFTNSTLYFEHLNSLLLESMFKKLTRFNFSTVDTDHEVDLYRNEFAYLNNLYNLINDTVFMNRYKDYLFYIGINSNGTMRFVDEENLKFFVNNILNNRDILGI